MHNPAELALRRPRVVVLATLLLVITGVLSYITLPRQENPDFRERHMSVQTHLPGAEPEKVELLISKVLEDAIAEVDDIEFILTTSNQGRSFLLLELKKTAPIEARFQEIRDKVQEARTRFPPGASEPEIDTSTVRTYTMILSIGGDGVPPLSLREQAKTFKRRLEDLPDVSKVSMLGEPEEEIEVALDLRALSQKGLPVSHVVSALAARNVLAPGGELDVGAIKSAIRTSGAYDSVQEIAGTYLGAGANGLPFQVGDVGTVTRHLKEDTVLVRTAGQRVVSLAVEMLPHRSVTRLGDRVRALIAEYEQTLPEGLAIHVVADEPTYVRARLRILTTSLLLGLTLVVGLVMFGMGWRSGLIVSVSIPLSLTIAMGGLSLAGVALHQISIAALVIAIGLVVDEAIVVTDNIQRHLDLGRSPRDAAIEGLGEIHLAVLAGALTTIAAFIPLALMRGDIGEFIRSIPISVSIMLVASVSVAHFVTPLLATGLHRWAVRLGLSARPERHRIEPLYRGLIRRVMRHTWIALLAFVTFLVLSVAVIARALWPPVFFPAADRHQFLIDVKMPMGSPVEETERVIRQMEGVLREEPDVRDFTAYVGAGAPKFYYNEFTEGRDERRGMFVVNTTDQVPFNQTPVLAARLDRLFKDTIVGAQVTVRELTQGYSGIRDVEIYVLGDNLQVLRQLSLAVRNVVKRIDGTANVEESFGYDPLTLDVQIDDAKANGLGITHRDLATTLRSGIDGIRATTFREDDEEIDVTVRLAEDQRTTVDDLASLQIYSPATGGTVPLAHVATLGPTWTTREINRWKRQREAVVSADVKGRKVVAVTNEIKRALAAEVFLPPGYSLIYEGENKELLDSFISLAKAALWAIFIIYIILVVQFNSLAQPLLIILAIPMALIGAVWGLALTGNSLGFMAFVGFIALTGIVVNDSIVLLDYINTLRRRGYALEDAVLTGASTRLRPVVLTSVTTIGGLLPLSLGGGSFWAPFGFAMIFGLAAATVLTLVVQPAAYLTLERYRALTAEPAGVGAPLPAATAD